MRIIDWFKDRGSAGIIRAAKKLKNDMAELNERCRTLEAENELLERKLHDIKKSQRVRFAIKMDEKDFVKAAKRFEIPGYDVPLKTPAVDKKLETRTSKLDKKLEKKLRIVGAKIIGTGYIADKDAVERLTRAQTAKLMDIQESTLQTYASTGRGPKVHKDGRSVYYLLEEVEDHIDKKRGVGKVQYKKNYKVKKNDW
jgi:hypothetical protein